MAIHIYATDQEGLYELDTLQMVRVCDRSTVCGIITRLRLRNVVEQRILRDILNNPHGVNYRIGGSVPVAIGRLVKLGYLNYHRETYDNKQLYDVYTATDIAHEVFTPVTVDASIRYEFRRELEKWNRHI